MSVLKTSHEGIVRRINNFDTEIALESATFAAEGLPPMDRHALPLLKKESWRQVARAIEERMAEVQRDMQEREAQEADSGM
jgi:hypothetical protein